MKAYIVMTLYIYMPQSLLGSHKVNVFLHFGRVMGKEMEGSGQKRLLMCSPGWPFP